jgi:tetratricopeptide (TPR) repeat protein
MPSSVQSLIEEADSLLSRVLRPGTHPRVSTIAQFEETGDLARVLSLYRQAMRRVPDEPSYPWNLATSLARLREYSLALAFVEEALRVAREVGDDEWADTYSHLAWADIAMRARQPEIALVALARALRLAEDKPARRDVLRMLRKLSPENQGALRDNLVSELSSLTA